LTFPLFHVDLVMSRSSRLNSYAEECYLLLLFFSSSPCPPLPSRAPGPPPDKSSKLFGFPEERVPSAVRPPFSPSLLFYAGRSNLACIKAVSIYFPPTVFVVVFSVFYPSLFCGGSCAFSLLPGDFFLLPQPSTIALFSQVHHPFGPWQRVGVLSPFKDYAPLQAHAFYISNISKSFLSSPFSIKPLKSSLVLR